MATFDSHMTMRPLEYHRKKKIYVLHETLSSKPRPRIDPRTLHIQTVGPINKQTFIFSNEHVTQTTVVLQNKF